MHPSVVADADAHHIRAALRAPSRAALRAAPRQARDWLRTAGRQARPLNGVLGWWAVTSFGVLGLLLAALAALWPSPVRMLGAAAAGSWLLFVALGRFGGGQLLRARYGGSRLIQAGAALLAVAGVIVVQLPAYDPTVAVAAISLAFGVAAAADAGAAPKFPSPARGCLRMRALCGLVAAMAVAVAPTTGLVVAAACVGLGEIVFAARLLPEVERLTGMLERDTQWTGPDEDLGSVLPLPGVERQ
ncbi:hypothetical protein [Dactylosporangium sp. NPDC000521]|uniref:hypothetical protein n=1 Tax=Dactylosporangium sp. NPDC000521 TaxID=3363975 RepID=UPI00369352CB